MTEKEFLSSIGINIEGQIGDDAYVVDIADSNEYGKVFSKLEKADALDPLEDNQVVTVQGCSLMFEAVDEPYILNLIADFDEDKYQLIVNKI